MNEAPKLYAINKRQQEYLQKLYPGIEVIITQKLPIIAKSKETQ